MTRYLADTFAFVEAFVGNPRYGRIMRAGDVFTTALNVLELHYSLLRQGIAAEEAERLSRAALMVVVEVPAEVAMAAARTRLVMNARLRKAGSVLRASYIDAWGYEASRALALRFLTGDRIFKGMPGVEFVT